MKVFDWNEWKGFDGKIKLQLQRNYITQGKAVFGFIWEFILLFGIASGNVRVTLYLGIGYYFLAYFFGRYLYKHEWVDADAEAANRYNPFVKQMRKKIGVPKTI